MVTSAGTPIFVGESAEAPAPNLDNGPAPGGTFRYGGESFAIPPIPCLLLSFMWGRDLASIDELEESVWPDGAQPSALKSALHKLNEVLCKARYPNHLGQKQGMVLWNWSTLAVAKKLPIGNRLATDHLIVSPRQAIC